MSNKQDKQAEALAADALHRIAFRLYKVWRQWGSNDYPEDQGVTFRDTLLLFADWMLYFIRNGCSGAPEVTNDRLAPHAQRILSLSDEDLMHCVGLCCIYQQSFLWHLHFLHNPTTLLSEASLKHKLAAFGRQLDWIYIVHDLQPEVAAGAYGLIVKYFGGEEYMTASKEQLGMNLVKTPLGWSEAASPELWDYIACGAYMSSKNQIDKSPAETKAFCDQMFGQF